MKVLFLHQSFPTQFFALAPALAARGDEVRALSGRAGLSEPQPGVEVLQYGIGRDVEPAVHPWLQRFQQQVQRGEACFLAARRLAADGYSPDVIIAHPGWGEGLFLKDVWPKAKLGLYCELYHQRTGLEVGFDPEFPVPQADHGPLLAASNQSIEMQLEAADAGLSPTLWQAGTFPERFRPGIDVIHDGVDTSLAADPGNLGLKLGDTVLSGADEIVTFANRHFEPLRGYHVFLRALPEILARRPRAHILLIGGEGPGYQYRPPEIGSWRERFLDEVRPRISDSDWTRVHFLGGVPYGQFLRLLRLSSVHVYLTYPYVLSWSLIEAMSAGCAIVASNTGPVREVIAHGETGRLVDFFDVAGLADQVCALLADPAERARLGAAARAAATAAYDLRTVCLPKQIAWVDRLAAL